MGYGQFDFKDQKSGLVCCWSLKNPTVLFILTLLLQIFFLACSTVLVLYISNTFYLQIYYCIVFANFWIKHQACTSSVIVVYNHILIVNVHVFQWPERIIHCDSGVTALDFSSYTASQLAVGMYDGSISICNVQSTEKTAIIDRRWSCGHFYSQS